MATWKMQCGGLDFSPVSGVFATNENDLLMAEAELEGGVDGAFLSLAQSVNLRPRFLGGKPWQSLLVEHLTWISDHFLNPKSVFHPWSIYFQRYRYGAGDDKCVTRLPRLPRVRPNFSGFQMLILLAGKLASFQFITPSLSQSYHIHHLLSCCFLYQQRDRKSACRSLQTRNRNGEN